MTGLKHGVAEGGVSAKPHFSFISLAKSTLWGSLWQVLRLALQVGYLLLLARWLGADGYGYIAGVVALAASLSPLVGLGLGQVLVQEVARAPGAFSDYWGRALTAVLLTGPVAALALGWTGGQLFPGEDGLVCALLLCAADLIFMPLVTLTSLAYVSRDQAGTAMFNHVQLNVLRILGLLLWRQLAGAGVLAFAWIYLGATFLSALVSCLVISRRYGWPRYSWSRARLSLKAGLGYSVSVAASTAHGEIDKTLLLGLSGAGAAGNYALATRVVSAATMPIMAYMLSVMPGLFRWGMGGLAHGLALVPRLWLPVLAYGTLAGLGIYFVLPMILPIFGPSFADAAALVPWLAALPLIVGCSHMGLNLLTASGRQWVRSYLDTGALVANVLLNLSLIPLWGAKGAVVSMMVSQALLALAPLVYLSLYKDRAWP